MLIEAVFEDLVDVAARTRRKTKGQSMRIQFAPVCETIQGLGQFELQALHIFRTGDQLKTTGLDVGNTFVRRGPDLVRIKFKCLGISLNGLD